MKLTSQWTGADIATAFSKMAAPLRHDLVTKILVNAAEPMRATAADLAPRGPGRGPHLADNIVIAETTRLPGGRGRWRDIEDHEHVIAIGPAHKPNDVFYGVFQEFGTAHHPAQPFLRPAFDQHRKSVMAAAGKSLGDALLRRVKGK
jgi:HK97 gp10 family phage protein